MKLIIDSGSTKSHWLLLKEGEKVFEMKGLGVNPFVQSPDEIYETLRTTSENLLNQFKPAEIFFYGTGCSTIEKRSVIQESLFRAGFHKVEINVQHDLLGAARALFLKQSGIACILGTGSSSGVYNGTDITDQVMSLGYVLGDEGAGVDMGKRLLVEVLKERLPAELLMDFKKDCNYSNQDIIDTVYASERPNQFIASFAPFLKAHLQYPDCKKIVEDSFNQFINLNLLSYDKSLKVGFIGSVAYSFRELLVPLIEKRGLAVGKILKAPMQGLIEYHSN